MVANKKLPNNKGEKMDGSLLGAPWARIPVKKRDPRAGSHGDVPAGVTRKNRRHSHLHRIFKEVNSETIGPKASPCSLRKEKNDTPSLAVF